MPLWVTLILVLSLPLGLGLASLLLLGLPPSMREGGLMGLWRTCILGALLALGGRLFWGAWLEWTTWAFAHWGA